MSRLGKSSRIFSIQKNILNILKIEIRQDFTFKNEISLLCKHKMCEIDRPIALHIHHSLDLDYYATALKKFDNNRTVIIFLMTPNGVKNKSYLLMIDFCL